MKKPLWTCFVLLISCMALVVKAQDPHYIQFSPLNGLPSSEVYDVAVDTNGIVWICTDRGVCRYNSYEFQTFTTREGLSNNSLLEIHTSPQGQLWFLGLDGSLSHTTQMGVRPFAGNQALMESNGRDRLIFRMLWGKDNSIYLFQKENLYNDPYCRKISLDGKHPQEMEFEELALAWENGNVHGLRYVEIEGQFVPEKRLSEFLVQNHLDAYYVTFSERDRLIRGRLEQASFRQEYRLPGVVNDLFFDHKGDLWVSTSNGIFLFQSGDLSRQPDHYFEGLAVSATVEDNEQNIWVSTLNQGVYLIPSLDFVSYDLQRTGVLHPTVTVFSEGKHHLFLGTQGGDLVSIDTNFEARLLASHPNRFNSLTYSSQNSGSTYINNFELREQANGKIAVESFQGVRRLALTLRIAKDVILTGGFGGYKVFTDNEQVKASPKDESLSVRNFCGLMYQGEVHLGSSNGILRVHQDDFTDASWLLPDKKLLQTRINDMVVDQWGNLWAGSIGNGMLYIQGDSVIPVGTAEGIHSNMINKIALDEQGRLWIASNEGLYWLDYSADGEFKVESSGSLGYKDGIPSDYIRDVAAFDGRIWVATDNGIVHFSPAQISERPLRTPKVFFEEIRMQKKVLPADSTFSFKSGENAFYFRYSGISNHKPSHDPFYRTRLLGLDSTWHYTNDRTAQFVNLRPGKYTFEVAARSNNGPWNPQPSQYVFEIQSQVLPPETFAALVGGFILIGILILIVVRRQRRKNAHF